MKACRPESTWLAAHALGAPHTPETVGRANTVIEAFPGPAAPAIRYAATRSRNARPNKRKA